MQNKKRKLTSHLLLTSDEFIEQKRIAQEEKENIALEKAKRKTERKKKKKTGKNQT